MYNYYYECRKATITSVNKIYSSDLDKDILKSEGLYEAIMEELRNSCSEIFFYESSDKDYFDMMEEVKTAVLDNLPLVVKCINECGIYDLKELAETIECENWTELDHITRMILIEDTVEELIKSNHKCVWHLTQGRQVKA